MFIKMETSAAGGTELKEILLANAEKVTTTTGSATQTVTFTHDMGYLLFYANQNMPNRPIMIAYRDGNTLKMLGRDYPQGSDSQGNPYCLKCEYIDSKSCSFTNTNTGTNYTAWNFYEE